MLQISLRAWWIGSLLFAIAPSTTAPKRYFEFQSNFWLNLHQTLFREAVRLDSGQPIKPLNTSELTAEELARWNKSVNYYQRHFHGRRLVFDPATISSVRVSQDWYGLEVLFHEASHPLAEKLEKDVSRECAAQTKTCDDLWHAVQFYRSAMSYGVH